MEAKQDAQVSHQYIPASELASMDDSDILSKTLSVKSVISTPSSFARQSRQAVGHPPLQIINEIGKGMQGIIFEKVGHSLVIKKELAGNERLRTNLQHEDAVHSAVVEVFQRYGQDSGVAVPRVHEMYPATDGDLWGSCLSEFPSEYRRYSTLLEMERILPLPKVTRRALISTFYPFEGSDDSYSSEIEIERILNDTPNKHCLVRVYLGRYHEIYTKEKFSLRNFPLSLESMQSLGLDVEGLATSMGKAFAIMHWGVGVNGDDVEFVLGTQVTAESATEEENVDIQHRAVGLWLLDFGQCDAVDLVEADADVVYQAFKGAMVLGDNQLFIPHYLKTPELFQAFKQGYVEIGRLILKHKGIGDRFDVEEFMNEYEEYAEDFL